MSSSAKEILVLNPSARPFKKNYILIMNLIVIFKWRQQDIQLFFPKFINSYMSIEFLKKNEGLRVLSNNVKFLKLNQ